MLPVGATGIEEEGGGEEDEREDEEGEEEEEEGEEEEELLLLHSVVCEFSFCPLVYIRKQTMCQKRNKNLIQ
jgi:hypothetical protein